MKGGSKDVILGFIYQYFGQEQSEIDQEFLGKILSRFFMFFISQYSVEYEQISLAVLG